MPLYKRQHKTSLFRKYKQKLLFFKEIQTKTIFRQNKREEKTNTKNESNIKLKILSLSTDNLNKDQINLLKLGLKFFPAPKSNIELKKDLKEFERNFRLIENKKETNDTFL